MDLLTGQTWGKLATECRLDQVIDHKNSWEGTEKIKPLSRLQLKKCLPTLEVN